MDVVRERTWILVSVRCRGQAEMTGCDTLKEDKRKDQKKVLLVTRVCKKLAKLIHKALYLMECVLSCLTAARVSSPAAI